MSAPSIRLHCPKTKLVLIVRHVPWDIYDDEPINPDKNFEGLDPRTLSLSTGIDQSALKKVCVLSSRKGRALFTAQQLLPRLGIPLKLFSLRTVSELTEGTIELSHLAPQVAQVAKSLMTKQLAKDCEVAVLITHFPHTTHLPRHLVGAEGFEDLNNVGLEKGDILWVNLDKKTFGVIKNPNKE
jgi:phosphohistidine phosphatase SixA